MSRKTEIAEEIVLKYAVALRDPTLKGDDRRQRLQDLIEAGLEKYGEVVAVGVAKQRREHVA